MKIKNIKEIAFPSETFNLHVEKDHNYIANGVVVSNCHSAKGLELKALLTDYRGAAHLPLRWGMTGTVPKDDFDFFAILGAIGPVVGTITAKELQDKGILSNCHISIKKTDDSHQTFKTYPEAYNFLVTDPDRIKWIAEYCSELVKTGNVLILFDRYTTGDLLAEQIEDLVIVNGKMSLKKRNKEYKSFSDDTKIICAATYGVAAVGINIPSLRNIVLIEPGKSFVRTIQSIGRGLRRSKEKDYVDIHDLCSNNKFSARHVNERIKYYDEAQYPHTTEMITIRR